MEEGLARYKQLHKELKKETEKARESWWKMQCDELEKMGKKGRSDLMYERVKILAKKRNAESSGYAVKNTDGILLTDAEEVRERWREYTEKLYDKEGKPNVEEMNFGNENEVQEDDRGPEMLRQEIVSALNQLKKGNAPGVDGIPGELLKECEEEATTEIVELCQQIYREGKWPEDFTQIVLIPLRKKSKCCRM